jgi:diguanylate cyclase (GGDEF)-like protein
LCNIRGLNGFARLPVMSASLGDPRIEESDAVGPAAQGRLGERRYSLRASLAGLVAACVIPLGLITASVVYAYYWLQRDHVYRETVLSARYLAADLDRELTAIESGLRVLVTSPELSTGDLASFHKRATDAVKGQFVSNYVLTDRQGRQLLNTKVPFGTPLPSSGRPIQLRDVFESGNFVVSDLFVGPVSRAPIIALGVPVYRGREVVYSLSIGIAPERILRVLQRRALPEGWVASVLDSSGTIVARTRDSQRFVGQRAIEQVVQHLASGRDDTIETLTVEGIPAVSSFSRSSLSNWSVAVFAPKAALEAKLYGLIAWFGTGLVAAAAIGFWLAARLAGRVTTAIRGLNEAALALGSGRPVELPRTHLIEADAVGAAILRAARILEDTQYLAHHDVMTGLCNRVLFDEVLTRQLAAAGRSGGSLAVLAVDLDDFKAVNDECGHAAGDRVLRAVGERIRQTVRGSDVAGRMGGDEFAVLMCEADASSARQLAERLVMALSEPYGARMPCVSASVGVAVFPEDGTDATALMEYADGALYEAKRLGKKRVIAGIGAPGAP